MEDAHSRDVLRVVAYGDAPPVLEKRHFYLDSEKVWRHGKVRGLNGLDLCLVLDRLEEFRPVILAPWTARKKQISDDGPAGVRGSVC